MEWKLQLPTNISELYKELKIMKEIRNKHLFFFLYLGGLFIFMGSIFSYAQVELNTYFFSREITEANSLCKSNLQSGDNTDFKYFKILSYNKGLETASIYCIFSDSGSNSRLDINKTAQWRVVFSTKINQERNWYWPLYF